MPYTLEGKYVMLNSLLQVASHFSLHHSRPVDIETGEVLPDSELPADSVYRRKQIAQGPAYDGESKNQRIVDIEVPEGAEVAAIGLWTSAFAGYLLAWTPVAPKLSFSRPGVVRVKVATLDLNLEV